MKPDSSNPDRPSLDPVLQSPGAARLVRQATLAAALADGVTRIGKIPTPEGLRPMIDALRSLGVRIRLDQDLARLEITGTGGHWPNGEAELDAGDDETDLHLLTAACCLGRGRYRIDVPPSCRGRSVRSLVDAMTDLGAGIGYAGEPGRPPLTVRAAALPGGTTRIPPISSLISSILLIAPYAQEDVFVELTEKPTGADHLAGTMKLMEVFDVQTIADDPMTRLIVPAPQRYKAAR